MRAEELPWYNKTPYKQLLTFVILLLGIISKHILDTLKANDKEIVNQNKRKYNIFRRLVKLFLKPFIASVIVFSIFWQAHGNEQLTFNYLIISFQNGFFWQTLIGK